MSGCCRCTLKQRAILSCLIPICLGSLVLCGAYMDLNSPIFVFVCLIMGSVTISTGILGMIGVATKVTAAIEVTGPLLGVESAMAVIMGSLFLLDLLFLRRRTAAPSYRSTFPAADQELEPASVLVHRENSRMLSFISPEGATGEQFVLKHMWVGYTAAALLIILGLMGCLVIELLGNYKTELNVDQLLRERARMWRHTEKRSPGKSHDHESKEEEKPLMTIDEGAEVVAAAEEAK